MRRYGFVRPLSFLGRLKPFFSFWQRKKRMGSKNVPLGAEETGKSGRTESSAPTGEGEDRRLQRCTATAPRPSSVCFADTFPEGKAIRCGGDRADRVVRPTGAAENRRNRRTWASALRVRWESFPRRGRDCQRTSSSTVSIRNVTGRKPSLQDSMAERGFFIQPS